VVAVSLASAVGAMAGAFIGTAVSTAITTGSVKAGLQAGTKAIASGAVSSVVNSMIQGGFGLAGLNEINIGGANFSNYVQGALGSAATKTILNGGRFGDNLATAIVEAEVDAVAKSVAYEIGDAFKNTDGTNVANYVAHGVLGCATAAARGQDCAAGAVGAVAGEVAAHGINFVAAATTGQTSQMEIPVFTLA
jgi:filamentous hemagglutinin